MKSWKKDRNYRKFKNGDGSFSYVITVDGERVEVDKEVYEAYSQEDRRERYLDECDDGVLLSIECMDEDKAMLEYFTDKRIESAEEAAICGILTSRMRNALALLPDCERAWIEALYFDRISMKKLAGITGIPRNTLIYRCDKILKKLARAVIG